MGASLALALKKKKVGRHILGFDTDAQTRRLAKKNKLCDQVSDTVQDCVRDSDLIFFATPVLTILSIIQDIQPYLKEGALLTDLGSTKKQLCTVIKKKLGNRHLFIGGHPMAGSEQSGIQAAQANLYKNKLWFLVPPSSRNSKALEAYTHLKHILGELETRVHEISAAEHDEVMAYVSHLPEIVSIALMENALKSKKGRSLQFAGSGFLDTTRIAASSAPMWVDIFLSNKKSILKSLENFEKKIAYIKKNIQEENARSLLTFFENVSEERKKL